MMMNQIKWYPEDERETLEEKIQLEKSYALRYLGDNRVNLGVTPPEVTLTAIWSIFISQEQPHHHQTP